ncbi:hypothetical protein V6N12_055809 [Hibiscus sabdariffa]|uniref:Uncharacterized protein n=1 Tax=Hibiscus sabdariffa TaxID=183260 RepID=A0ABR2ARW9_9ROSI
MGRLQSYLRKVDNKIYFTFADAKEIEALRRQLVGSYNGQARAETQVTEANGYGVKFERRGPLLLLQRCMEVDGGVSSPIEGVPEVGSGDVPRAGDVSKIVSRDLSHSEPNV